MTTTTFLGITKIEPGQEGAHPVANTAFDQFDKAIAGRLAINLTGLATKSLTGGESTNHILHVTATSGACDLVIQAVAKTWTVINDGSHTITLKVSGQVSPTPPTIAAGGIKMFVCDGTAIRAYT